MARVLLPSVHVHLWKRRHRPRTSWLLSLPVPRFQMMQKGASGQDEGLELLS